MSQYIRKYPSFLAKQTAKSYILLYFILVLINSFVDFISIRYSVLQQIQWSSYASPIIVAESAALMLFFSKLSFKSKIINWIATSCFAVYLLHCTRNILEEYCGLIKSAYDSHNFIRIIFIIISVFVISIIVDKVRIVLWNNILRWLDRKKIYINSQNAK